MDSIHQSAQTPGRKRIVAHWHANQLVVTYHSFLDITAGKKAIIASLNLESLDRELTTTSGFSLTSFSKNDLPHAHKPDNDSDRDRGDRDSRRERRENDDDDNALSLHHDVKGDDSTTAARQRSLQSPIGKYLFPHHSGKGTLVVSFFHINSTNAAEGVTTGSDNTTTAIKLINGNPRQFINSDDAQLFAAMPNWFNAGTGGDGPSIITQGCPVAPPMPANDACTSGNWHITLPSELPETIQSATGNNVSVFVLDTLPTQDQILQAVNTSGGSNSLLLDFFENVTPNYQFLSDALDASQPSQPATGNDINGDLTGFPMSDHGVFIAGIIRDLAPGATVECIRVLNDYGVGDTATLLDALQQIQSRILDGSVTTPVVVNMSLTTAPAIETLASLGFDDQNNIAAALRGLLLAMLSLEQSGVVFTASSGNGSGPHDKYTNPPGTRVLPRYPAAFAYPFPGALREEETLKAMIPVGAVNQSGVAASYSNYPGTLGIGAYGGELPTPASGTADTQIGTHVQQPVDCPRGIYTADYYPALSASDTPLPPLTSPPPVSYPEYVPSPAVTWAYWPGTSFATPIISALAARVLETQPSTGDSVRQTLLTAAPAQVDWTNLDTGGDAMGPRILTSQECQDNVS